MPKRKPIADSNDIRICPSMTPEGDEAQAIALAINLAKRQLMDGTASSQVITHFLKLATEREQAEIELLKQQQELAKAKIESIENSRDNKEATERALNAFRRYSGSNVVDDDNDYMIYE